jgi:hypothetical protein
VDLKGVFPIGGTLPFLFVSYSERIGVHGSHAIRETHLNFGHGVSGVFRDLGRLANFHVASKLRPIRTATHNHLRLLLPASRPCSSANLGASFANPGWNCDFKFTLFDL